MQLQLLTQLRNTLQLRTKLHLLLQLRHTELLPMRPPQLQYMRLLRHTLLQFTRLSQFMELHLLHMALVQQVLIKCMMIIMEQVEVRKDLTKEENITGTQIPADILITAGLLAKTQGVIGDVVENIMIDLVVDSVLIIEDSVHMGGLTSQRLVDLGVEEV